MIMGMNQPYFMPYIYHWQLINAADVFVLGDDYNFINRGWVNRNRILVNGQPKYFNIEVDHASQNKKINELYISEIFDPEKKLQILKDAYSKAPHFEEGYALMQKILKCEERNLAYFLEHSIRCVSDYLGITTKFVRSSEIPGNSEFKREYRIYDQCRYVGADTYINATGGRAMYDFAEFEKRNLKLGFIQNGDIQYPQFGQEFVPYLSMMDMIMFQLRDEIREMLNNCQIVWE